MLKFSIKAFTVIFFIFTFSLGYGGQLQGEGEHTFYLYQKSSSAKIYTTSEEDAKNFIYFKKDLTGESVVFYNKENLLKLLSELNATLIFEENGEDFSCEYYFSPKLTNQIILRGNKINLHVCSRDGIFTVGTPLVFGSF